MSQNDFLRPKGAHTQDIDRRKMENGQFRNPPFYMQYGGFSSATKGMFDQNKMTLERGGPQTVRGRPI
jgi:hypothetical protein